jgi:hypothetical protein
MFTRACCLVVGMIAVAGAPRGSTPEDIPRWWLESGSKLIAMDERASRLAEIDAGENVVSVQQAFRRIAVASVGAYAGNTTLGGRREFWPAPGSGSKVTVLDAATLAVLASRTVPFFPTGVRVVNADTLVVVSDGQVSGDAQKEIQPAVTILRAPKWEATATIPLKTPPTASGGRRAAASSTWCARRSRTGRPNWSQSTRPAARPAGRRCPKTSSGRRLGRTAARPTSCSRSPSCRSTPRVGC